MDSMQGVDWSRAPDESAAESARLDRSGNRYAAWPDETGAEGSRLSRQGNAYAYWPDETGAEAARLDRYETKARFLANASKVWAAEDVAANRAGLAQQHRAADAYRSELRQKGEDAMRLSGGPRGGTGADYGDASAWNMRDASTALRGRAPESTFGYGFGLGSRSVLEGVPITAEEKIGRGLGELWAGAKASVYTMTGARSFDLAVADFKAENYGFAALHGMQSLGEAGLTLMGLGVGGVRTSATVMQFPGTEVTAAARASYVGNTARPGSLLLNAGEGAGPLYDPDKLARILTAAQKQGATVMQVPEAERLLNAIGAKAAYFPAEGGPGTFIFSSNPTRSEVLEELMHYGQYRQAGFPSSGTLEGQIQGLQFEVQAQQRLGSLAERLNWTPAEIAHFRSAEKTWQQLLNEALGRGK